MARPLTLPVLQMRLDQLMSGQSLNLPMAEVERIFGLNDVASRRINNFAKGHNCAFAWLETGVQFLNCLPGPGLVHLGERSRQ
jgi:hypothetical protein